MSEHLHAFAQEAARFEKWATEPRAMGVGTARQALIRIANLYSAALYLPAAWTNDLLSQPDSPGLDPSEHTKIVAYKSIPVDMYSEVFDPLEVPSQEPVIGSVVDDIIDIYVDVVTGLRAYQRGDLAIARWEWSFTFANHWGAHATGAIRAIHAWLAANPDQPAAGSEPK